MAGDDSSEGGPVAEGGEFRSGAPAGTTLLSGQTFTFKPAVYADVDGVAIFEGDIALGSVEEIESATSAARREPGVIAQGVGITGSAFRWPDCTIPYTVDPALPDAQRVPDAIAHWEANTSLRFVERTTANQAQHPNWMHFVDEGGCWSFVGMRSTGEQKISIGTGCPLGSVIHEIGHAVGLWHEQSREDRDLFVTINWENILEGREHNFAQHISDGDDLGGYDHGSIMHYPRTAFTRNGLDTITPVDGSASIGQRTGLSAGDIAAVEALYPGCGKRPWDEVVKQAWDEVVKQVWREPIKQPWQEPIKQVWSEPLKGLRDPIKQPALDPPKHLGDTRVTKTVGDPIGPRPLTPLSGLRPFSLATPHHAASARPGSGSALGALRLQILELEAAIAAVNATAAEATAEAARLSEHLDQLTAAYRDALGGGAGA